MIFTPPQMKNGALMRISHHKARKQKAQSDPDQITNREGHEERNGLERQVRQPRTQVVR
jgi:hypothetical protein